MFESGVLPSISATKRRQGIGKENRRTKTKTMSTSSNRNLEADKLKAELH
jgi:hypothetical protein